MASAAPRESSAYQRSGGGGGAGGKVRKNTYRNTQATPYDRPLTALRNSNNSVKNTNGWLSRLVDPASKIITESARKILSSVFSKRILPSTAPKQPASDGALQLTNKHQETSAMVYPLAEQNTEDVASGHPKLDIDEVSELEQILKQKRFTRYEIDRLTTLLRSRTVNGSIRDEEGTPSIKIANEEVFKEHAYSPQRDTIIPFYRSIGPTPTPTSRHKVFDEDITSPSELAKAYMSSRTSKFTPMLDSRGLTPNYWTPNISLESKSLIESRHLDSGLVSVSSGCQATASSSGRARRSKMHQRTSLKGSEFRKVAYGEPSSSTYELSVGQHQASEFKNSSLKRRSSVLQDQFGSIGPIRRVRQKLNLLTSKGIDALARENPSPICGSRDKSEALADASTDFIEMDQQTEPLLGQLDSFQNEGTSDQISGSTMEKYPPISASETQISRNFEKGESSGVKEDVRYDYTINDSRDTSLYVTGYSAKEDSKTNINEQKLPNCFYAEKNSDTEVLKNTSQADATFCIEKNYVVEPFQKKQAFCMSVLEDFVDMDDDGAEGTLDGSTSATSNGKRHPLISSVGIPPQIGSSDLTEVEKPSVVLPSGSSTMGGAKSISLRGPFDSASSGLKLHAPDLKLEASRSGSGPADINRISNPGDKINVSLEARHLFSKPQEDTVAATPDSETSSIFPFGDTTSNKGSLFNSSPGSSLHPTVVCSEAKTSSESFSTISFSSPFGVAASAISETSTPLFSFSTSVTSTALNSHPQNSAASDYGSELVGGNESTVGSQMAPRMSTSAPMTGSSGTANKAASSLNSMTPSTQPLTPGTSKEIHFSSSSASTSSLFGSMPPSVGLVGASSSAPVVTSFAASYTSASATDASTNFIFGDSSTTANGAEFTFGATTTTGPTTSAANDTAFVLGASSTPSSVTTSSGISFGASSAPSNTISTAGFSFGASSTPVNTISTAGYSFGASSAPVNATSTTGFSVGASSATANVTCTSGFSFGASSSSAPASSWVSSIAATTSSELPSGASSTLATPNNGFSFGASSTPATTSGFSFGASSTAATSNGFSFGASATTSSGLSFGASPSPATTSGFSFGASSTPAITSSGFSFMASSTPTTSSGFSFGASSTPATSSGFSFGASSIPAVVTTGAGFPNVISSTPAPKTTSSGFFFGAPSTTGTNAAGAAFLAGPSSSPTGVSSSAFPSGVSSTPTSSAFLFGASSTSTPVTTIAGFLSGSSSAHTVGTSSSAFQFGSSTGSGLSFGASSTNPNPFSFGAASTAATTTSNNGSPFGFMSGSSTFPFNAGAANINTPATQPIFGNSNPFGSTAAVNNNSMEDSMAEDSVQAFPVFGQPSANTPGFGFSAPSGSSNSFQFGSQPNPSPFQASGSLGGFNAGGSFSLGSGGDKSNRRIIKPKKGGRRK